MGYDGITKIGDELARLYGHSPKSHRINAELMKGGADSVKAWQR